MTPPSVSTPRERGVTSSSKTSFTSPTIIPAWIAAPTATTSSGLTLWLGSLPPVSLLTKLCTAGILVEPPTRITSLMSLAVSLASAKACFTGPSSRSMRSWTNSSNLARVSFVLRCFGPLASAVTKGRLIDVSTVVESSHLAFSAAS